MVRIHRGDGERFLGRGHPPCVEEAVCEQSM